MIDKVIQLVILTCCGCEACPKKKDYWTTKKTHSCCMSPRWGKKIRQRENAYIHTRLCSSLCDERYLKAPKITFLSTHRATVTNVHSFHKSGELPFPMRIFNTLFILSMQQTLFLHHFICIRNKRINVQISKRTIISMWKWQCDEVNSQTTNSMQMIYYFYLLTRIGPQCVHHIKSNGLSQ